MFVTRHSLSTSCLLPHSCLRPIMRSVLIPRRSGMTPLHHVGCVREGADDDVAIGHSSLPIMQVSCIGDCRLLLINNDDDKATAEKKESH